MQRRSLMKAAAAIALLPMGLAIASPGPLIEVYKNEGCGCCEGWIQHLEEAGFKVKASNVADTASWRNKLSIPQRLGSCHTAVVDGYAIEGHVPASEIRRLLKEKPRAVGLAVPGMPTGSPGMEGAHRDAYDVLLVQAGGKTSVYRHYAGDR